MKSSKIFFFSILTIFVSFLILEILLRTLDVEIPKNVENFNLSSKFTSQPPQKQSFSLLKTFKVPNYMEAPPGMTITVSNLGNKYSIKLPIITTPDDFQSFQKKYLTQVDKQLYVFKINVKFPNYKIKIYSGMQMSLSKQITDKDKITVFYEIPKYFSSEELNKYMKEGVIIDSEVFNKTKNFKDKGYIVKHPDLGYMLKPYVYYQAKSGGKLSKLNSEGFRDSEFNSLAKYKILVLGSSTSFGIGIESTKNVFSSLLEKKLNSYLKLLNLNETVEVYNASVPSYSIFQGFMSYETLKNKTHWDFVIAMFGWNPPTQIFRLKNHKSNSVDHKKFPKIKEFFNQFRSYSVLQKKIKNNFTSQNNWDKIASKKLVESVLESGAQAVLLPLIYTPKKFSKSYTEKIKQINKNRKDVANDYGIYFIESLSKIKLEREVANNWVDNIHFGVKGHEIISDHLFEFFQKELNLN